MAVRPIPAQPALYRLRLWHIMDFARSLEALGQEQYLPPGHLHTGLGTVEYELYAQPPARWRLRRVRDIGGEPPGRDERLVDGNRWYWFHPNDDVEYDEYRPEDAVAYDDYQHTAPETFRHLFTPDALLSLCRVEHV